MSSRVPLDPLRPTGARRLLLRGGFKTVALNGVGWAALAGAGLVAGGVGALVTPLRPGIALPGGVVAGWGAAVVLDHVRWRNGYVSLTRDELEPATGAAIVAELRSRGIETTYDEHVFDGDDCEHEDCEHDDCAYTQRSIRCRRRDVEKVAALVEARLG